MTEASSSLPSQGSNPSSRGLEEQVVPPSSQNPPEAQPSYTFMEVVNVLTSFRQNHERMKMFRVSLSVLRFLSILNFVYTILGVTFLMLAMCTDWTPEFNPKQRDQFHRIGVAVSIFAPLASLVDLMALRGLHMWRRSLLLPWLFLYAFAVLLILANALAGLFHHGFKWTYLVLMLCSLSLYSAWRHIRAQYTEMARERPVARTIEELAQDIRDTTSSQASAFVVTSDLPPKYEELDQPPVYSEVRVVPQASEEQCSLQTQEATPEVSVPNENNTVSVTMSK